MFFFEDLRFLKYNVFKYGVYLKNFGMLNLIDGIDFLIWFYCFLV